MNYLKYSSCALLVLFIVIFLLLLTHFKKINEGFSVGYGTSFSEFITPQPCSSNNDCYPGYYFRSQQYQNICEPQDMRILRKKRDLQDVCVREI